MSDLIKKLIGLNNFIIRKMLVQASKLVIFSGGVLNHSSPDLYECDYNCGFKNARMTERGIELILALKKIEEWEAEKYQNIIEVGAVTPYYFNRIKDILDAYDKHPLVNLRMDLLDYDFRHKNVISISTLEHVGTGEYGIDVRKDSIFALNKIYAECDHCFITCPIGYNKKLDNYCRNHQIEGLSCWARGCLDNNWRKIDKNKAFKKKYSHLMWANAIFVVEK